MAFCGDSKPTSKPTLQHHIAFGRMLDSHGLSTRRVGTILTPEDRREQVIIAMA